MAKKLPGKIDGSLITENFFPDYINHRHNINQGLCMKWAYIAFLLYEDVVLYSNNVHAFVKQGGLFFDSEVPNGVSYWQHLPCNEMYEEDIEGSWYQTTAEFFHEWKDEFPVKDRVWVRKLVKEFLDKQAQVYVPRYNYQEQVSL